MCVYEYIPIDMQRPEEMQAIDQELVLKLSNYKNVNTFKMIISDEALKLVDNFIRFTNDPCT